MRNTRRFLLHGQHVESPDSHFAASQKLYYTGLLYNVSHGSHNQRHRKTSDTPCFAKILCALKIARFPGTMAVASRLSLHPRAPRICPGEPELYTCIYKGRNPDVFTTLRRFGLGSPIVPVVQPSQSHMRKDDRTDEGLAGSVLRRLKQGNQLFERIGEDVFY